MNKIEKVGLIFALVIFSFSSCDKKNTTSEITKGSEDKSSSLIPVAVSKSEDYEYENQGIAQEVIESFSSEDGLCIIKKYPSYYDVTLDYENGSPSQVGTAYAECIYKVFPNFAEYIEPYLYENINFAFSGLEINFNELQHRIDCLVKELPADYRDEIHAFALALSYGVQGYEKDSVLSYEEVLAYQMVADALRGTACSGLSLWGDKTESGKPLTIRILEWNLGSECQMGAINAVVHEKKGKESITSISFLGMHGIVSAVNNEGVFAAILDVGSWTKDPINFEGKKAYTYEIRNALEKFSNAFDAADYLVRTSPDFTYCHNVFVTDSSSTFCCEDAILETMNNDRAYPELRTPESPIFPGLTWEDKNSFCVVNSFTTDKNQDYFTNNQHNIVRFAKYNALVKSREKFSPGTLKTSITAENVQDTKINRIHSPNTIQIILVDYETKHIQVAFTGTDGVKNRPDFIDIGTY